MHTTLAIIAAIAVLIALYIFMRKESFIETQFGGYMGAFGDKRSMVQQNFGIDDSIRGVFSSRIMTPKETYVKLVVRDDSNPYQLANLKLASTAKCKLACAR